MKEFMNKHLTAIIAAVFALIVVIVLAVVFIGGNDKDKKPGTENPGTEVNTEIDSEATETLGDVEDTQADTPNTEVTTPDTPSTEATQPSETPAPQPSETPQSQAPTYTYTELNKTMYAKSSVNVRDLPSTDGTKIGSLSKGQAVTVTGQCNETKWYRINLDGKVAYVSNSYLVDTKPATETPSTPSNPDSGNGESSSNSNIQTINGFTFDFSDDSEISKNWKITLAKAGFYTPVWRAETNRYYMIIKNFEERYTYYEYLQNYIIERGGTPGVGGGSYLGCTTPEGAYLIHFEVMQE